MNADKIKETAKLIAALVTKGGATYSEVSEIFDEVKRRLLVVPDNGRIVYRDGVPYERKPYAREYTPVNSADT